MSTLTYRPEIDGLRAVAVVPVILFHAGVSLFAGGFVGVDVFFVISGYLITTILIKDLEAGQFSLARFYERRARRILPALFFVVICCAPFAWAWMLPSQLKDFSQAVVAVTLFASNILFWKKTNYFSPAAEENPLLHTWSLAVEEQFYIFFPILLWLLWRYGRRRVFWFVVVLCVLSLGTSEWAWRNTPTANFYLIVTRAWELGAGALCAFILLGHTLKPNTVFSALGLGLILFSIFFFDSSTPFPSLYAIAPVGGTVLIILFAGSDTVVGRLLSTRVLVGFGLISYSAYLWHQPLFAFARLSSLTEPSGTTMLVCATASLGLAYGTWRFVEQPFRRRAGALLPTQRGVWIVSAGVASVFIAAGVAGHVTNGTWARSATLPAYIFAAKTDKNNYRDCLPGAGNFDPGIAVQACSAGAQDAPLVVLLGDSHADHYAFALRKAAAVAGFRFWQLTVNSCLPFEGLVARNRDCSDYATQVQALLEDARPELIVLSARWTLYLTGERFDNGEGGVEHGPVETFIVSDQQFGAPGYAPALASQFETGIKDLLTLSPRLLMVYPSPEAGWNVPNLYAKTHLRQGAGVVLSTDAGLFEDRNAAAHEFLDGLSDSRISRFKASEVLCDTAIPERCVNAFNRKILYYDDDHFSNTGALFLQDALVGAVRAALFEFGE